MSIVYGEGKGEGGGREGGREVGRGEVMGKAGEGTLEFCRWVGCRAGGWAIGDEGSPEGAGQVGHVLLAATCGRTRVGSRKLLCIRAHSTTADVL